MKKLIALIATVIILASCSKKEVSPYKKITYKFYNSRVPYDVQYYSTTEEIHQVTTKYFEITVDFDEKYYRNNTSGVWAVSGDTSKVEIISEGRTAKKEIVSKSRQLVGFNYNGLK